MKPSRRGPQHNKDNGIVEWPKGCDLSHPFALLEVNQMSVIQCSMCRRAAAWLIDAETFCEGHKEMIIAEVGVDRFTIRRLTDSEQLFQVGGRFSRTTALKKGGNKSDGQSHSASR